MSQPARTDTPKRTQTIETNTKTVYEWYVMLRKSLGNQTDGRQRSTLRTDDRRTTTDARTMDDEGRRAWTGQADLASLLFGFTFI